MGGKDAAVHFIVQFALVCDLIELLRTVCSFRGKVDVILGDTIAEALMKPSGNGLYLNCLVLSFLMREVGWEMRKLHQTNCSSLVC